MRGKAGQLTATFRASKNGTGIMDLFLSGPVSTMIRRIASGVSREILRWRDGMMFATWPAAG
jgi:hypothetical protein